MAFEISEFHPLLYRGKNSEEWVEVELSIDEAKEFIMGKNYFIQKGGAGKYFEKQNLSSSEKKEPEIVCFQEKQTVSSNSGSTPEPKNRVKERLNVKILRVGGQERLPALPSFLKANAGLVLLLRSV